MKKRIIFFSFLCIFISMLFCSCTSNTKNVTAQDKSINDTLYQVSTLDALMQGVYNGEISLKSLLSHGDFGIGTFDALEGEMVVLDGSVYQVLVSGEINEPEGTVKTPFAMITEFSPDIQSDIDNIDNYAQLTDKVYALLPSDNIFYAIKVEGTFPYIKTRSVAKQTEPYPKLAEVTSDQQVFEFHDAKGTLIGYWCPCLYQRRQSFRLPTFTFYRKTTKWEDIFWIVQSVKVIL